MKTLVYVAITLILVVCSFVAGRITTPGYAQLHELSEGLKKTGLTPTQCLEKINSIKNQDEWGRQMAALVSVRALRFIEENRLDATKQLLTVPVVSFYKDFSGQPQEDMTADILKLTNETALICPTLKTALSK